MPGMAVVVVREGRIVHLAGIGKRELVDDLRVTEETLFRVDPALFVARSVATLAQDGRLDLSRSIPAVTGSTPVGELLCSGGDPEKLAGVVQEITGRPWGEFARVRFFEPNAMELTFPGNEPPALRDVAFPHGAFDAPVSDAVWTCARDLGAWLSLPLAELPEEPDCSQGWTATRWRDHPMLYRKQDGGGWGSHLSLLPGEALGVAVVVNGDAPDFPAEVAQGVYATLVPLAPSGDRAVEETASGS